MSTQGIRMSKHEFNEYQNQKGYTIVHRSDSRGKTIVTDEGVYEDWGYRRDGMWYLLDRSHPQEATR